VERYTQGPGIDEPLVGQRQPKIFYYEADGLGSTTSLTDPTGAVAATYTYDSFGFMTASTGSATNWFRYTARQFDSSTALYYYRARYYDSMTGRFLSEDPAGTQGSDLNLYRYTRNNPTDFTDPMGLLTVDPNFASYCLPSLQRALDIVGNVATKNERCNCLFRQIGNHRSLKELVDDSAITIHYKSEEGRGDERLQKAYTNPGDKKNIYIRPYGCRLGAWALASVLVHELTHITLSPGEGQEDRAGLMEVKCGFQIQVVTPPITVTPK
jgi:RHS repeat-associated protein